MKKRRSSRPRRRLPPWLGLLATAAAAVVVGLWSGGTNAYLVPSDSMMPTLLRGDQFRADVWLAPRRGPRRGEIWVLNNPQPGDGNGSVLVKRVVGLPGETVAMARGRVLVNGAALDEPYCASPASYDVAATKLGPDSYWVLGDNRDRSQDSHAWGAVSRRAFIGRAFFRYWPLARCGRL